MEMPDYKGGSIVNLMSSIAGVFGTKMPYPELRIMPSKEIKNATNIVLLVIDGLGYEYLKNKTNSFLYKNCRDKITSVFLPTTTCAVTTFTTGVPPQQHGLTGWFMFLKELGIVSTTILFKPRIGGESFSKLDREMKEIFTEKAFTEKIKTNSYAIYHKNIINSDYTKATTKNAKIIPYNSINDFTKQIEKTIKSSKKKKYIFAYWMDFDSTVHENGVDSKKASNHFKELDKKISLLNEKIKGTNTIIIVTADHGAVNTPKNKIIKLEDHPQLNECLTLPICGEGRTAYCYVHPSKTEQFENYVKKKLEKYCWVYKSEDIIKNNFYGLFEPNKKLQDRIGDYVLIMKENYSFKDNIENKKSFLLANHGGVTKEEMLVPLIILKD